MATFDEAFSVAQTQLTETGMLINNQLVAVAEGDETLAQQIREALIQRGLAEDRFGVALAFTGQEPAIDPANLSPLPTLPVVVKPSPEIVIPKAADDLPTTEADWWLMSAGVTSGPFDFEKLCQMLCRGQVKASDLVRHTARGVWQRPEQVAELNAVLDNLTEQQPKTAATSRAAGVKPAPDSDADLDAMEDEYQTPVGDVRRTSTASTFDARHSSAASDDDEYYLWDAGKAAQAITRRELEDRLRAGRLTADDFVQVGQDGDWQPIGVALSGRRPPLGPLVEAAARQLAKLEQSDAALDVSRSTPKQDRDQKRQRNMPRNDNGTVGKLSSSGSRNDLATERDERPNSKTHPVQDQSSIGLNVERLSKAVGGKGRLTGLSIALVAGLALIVWCRQPPSASSVYAVLDQCHQTVESVRRQQIRGQRSSTELAHAEARVRLLRDGLEKRASSRRPAEQELLWACDYGLLPMLKENAAAGEYERAYGMHMSRALRLIDPEKAKKLDPSVPERPAETLGQSTIPGN